MTIVAWDGKTLAADKRCGSSKASTVTKIHRIKDEYDRPMLVGGSGSLDLVLGVIDWIRKGRNPETFSAIQRDKDDWQPVLVIEPDGTPSLYERSPHPIRYEQRCVAIGSGCEYARAAMYLGCDARRAVEVASALDNGCGNGIDTLTLELAAPDSIPLKRLTSWN